MIKVFAKLLFNIGVFLLTYLGGSLFTPFRKGKKPDISREHAQKIIESLPVEHWRAHLTKFGLTENGKNKKILEVGSGGGQWLATLGDLYMEVHGVEPNDELRLISKKRILKTKNSDKIFVEKSGAENLPYDDQMFDVVICIGVLMFTDQKQAFGEFSRVLKSNGKLVVTANGIGYFVMYIQNGMQYFSIEMCRYGVIGIFSTLLKRVANYNKFVSAVDLSEMRQLGRQFNLEIKDWFPWAAINSFPLKKFGFVTNYAFIFQKLPK